MLDRNVVTFLPGVDTALLVVSVPVTLLLVVHMTLLLHLVLVLDRVTLLQGRSQLYYNQKLPQCVRVVC